METRDVMVVFYEEMKLSIEKLGYPYLSLFQLPIPADFLSSDLRTRPGLLAFLSKLLDNKNLQDIVFIRC